MSPPLPFVLFASPDGNEGRYQLRVGRFAVGRREAAFTLRRSDAPLRAGTWEATDDGQVTWTPEGGEPVRCVDGSEHAAGGLRMVLETHPRGPVVRIAPGTGGLGEWLSVDLSVPYTDAPAPPPPTPVVTRGQAILIAVLAVIALGLTVARQQQGSAVVGGDAASGAVGVVVAEDRGADGAATAVVDAPPPAEPSGEDVPVPSDATPESPVETAAPAGAPPRPVDVEVDAAAPAPDGAPPNHRSVVVYAYESVDGVLSYTPGTLVILDDGGTDIAYQTEVRQFLWDTKPEHQACFTALRSAQPGARGLMWVDVLVGEGGEVLDGFIIAEESTLLDADTLDCLMTELRRVDFREPPAPPFEFAYPFELSLGTIKVPPPPG